MRRAVSEGVLGGEVEVANSVGKVRWLIGAGWLIGSLATAAVACLAVGGSGQSIRMREEQAILIWDEGRQTQHFLRRATFETNGDSLAFLVPTPSVPTFSESDNTIFDKLLSLTAPRIEVRKRARSWGCSEPVVPNAPLATDVKSVVVHSRTQLTGQEVVVLSADEPETLISWLQDHGFSTHDRLTDWLRPYLKRGWKISAFRYTNDPAETVVTTPPGEEGSDSATNTVAEASPGPASSQSAEAATLADEESVAERTSAGARAPAVTKMVQPLKMPAVCLSFQTATPFYPYREAVEEPRDSGPQRRNRSLRLFCFSTGRMDGFLSQTRRLWAGTPVWSQRLSVPVLGKLRSLRALKGLDLFDVPHLTEFEDLSAIRPDGLDVEFERAASQSNLERPPEIREIAGQGFGADAIAIGVVCVALVRRWSRRR